MADVAADVNGEVATDGAGGGGEGVGGTEDGCSELWLDIVFCEKGYHGEGINVLRPVLTASRPSQTMAQMGPLSMSVRR